MITMKKIISTLILLSSLTLSGQPSQMDTVFTYITSIPGVSRASLDHHLKTKGGADRLTRVYLYSPVITDDFREKDLFPDVGFTVSDIVKSLELFSDSSIVEDKGSNVLYANLLITEIGVTHYIFTIELFRLEENHLERICKVAKIKWFEIGNSTTEYGRTYNLD